MSWTQWIDAPGSGHLRTFKEIITSCAAWWDLIPDQSLLASGVGSGDAFGSRTVDPGVLE
ncbi:MAG: hypothetical protein JW934_04695 [Anaerolineae bacterium]|nr:hypothetical protein [Anaerolineae bacterium]